MLKCVLIISNFVRTNCIFVMIKKKHWYSFWVLHAHQISLTRCSTKFFIISISRDVFLCIVLLLGYVKIMWANYLVTRIIFLPFQKWLLVIFDPQDNISLCIVLFTHATLLITSVFLWNIDPIVLACAKLRYWSVEPLHCGGKAIVSWLNFHRCHCRLTKVILLYIGKC